MSSLDWLDWPNSHLAGGLPAGGPCGKGGGLLLPFFSGIVAHQRRACLQMVRCYALLLVSLAVVTVTGSSRDAPLSYCVDNKVVDIFSSRIERCLAAYSGLSSPIKGTGTDSIAAQLELLRAHNAYEYFKSNELLAFDYFVNVPNPFRVAVCADAEFEYVPMLPLHWAVEMAAASTNPACTYRALVQDITTYVDYKRSISKNNGKVAHTAQPFVVASTFNLRTEVALGLQTQARRGAEWEKVSEFVMSANLLNYERLHECPDILRKQWRFIVETPTLPAASLLGGPGDVFVDADRPTYFYFSGRFAGDLYGPERFCSVRVALMNVDKSCLRGPDGAPLSVVFDNTTLAYSRSGGVSQRLVQQMRTSVYCIIAKSNSYSSSFFYSAIHSGCVPVVVSDWFSFAHPSLVDYSRFVLRIAEDDFLKCSTCALMRVASLYGRQQLRDMRQAMLRVLPLLSYEPEPAAGPRVQAAVQALHHDSLNSTRGDTAGQKYSFLLRQLAGSSPAHKASLPLLLSLLEMRHFSSADNYQDRYFRCYAPHSCNYGDATPQVRSLRFSPPLPDQRQHLCRHVARLIGYYKIVYFMQCVRILWPLKPADNFRPADMILLRATNASGRLAEGSTGLAVRPGHRCDAGLGLGSTGLTPQEFHIVRAFHKKIESVAYMAATMDSSYIYPVDQSPV